MGGPDESQGRLEIYRDGYWGTVCSDHYDYNAQKTACLTLGVNDAGSDCIIATTISIIGIIIIILRLKSVDSLLCKFWERFFIAVNLVA